MHYTPEPPRPATKTAWAFLLIPLATLAVLIGPTLLSDWLGWL